MDEKAASPPALFLWRHRDFMLLWGGQIISVIGSMMSVIALPLLILSLTHSATQAGLVGALYSLPYFLLSLPAGALVDRWDRKRVMLLCDSGQALALGSIPLAFWMGHLRMVQLYLVALSSGALFTFFNVAEAACLPRIVPREQLPAATARNQAIEPVASLLGPPLSGALFQLWRALPFLADALSYVASVVSLLFIKTQFQGERTAAQLSLKEEITEGLAWLWHQPLIRYMAFLTGGYNFVFSGTFLLVIVLAKQQHAPAPMIGAIFSIAAVGGLLGAVAGGWIQKRLSFGRAIIAVAWTLALVFPLYAVAPNPVIVGAITAVSYFVNPIYNVVQFSYRLSLIPDALQGRVNSVFRLFAFGTQPLGAGLSGLLLQSLGPRPTALVFSACLLVLAVVTTLNAHVRCAPPIAETLPA
jgi:MFS family permease